MDEERRKREREAAAGDPGGSQRLVASKSREGKGRGLPRWNPLTRVQCTFAFECPKQWTQMETTEDPNVRFCAHCEKPVHLAESADAFDAHAKAGNCVAVPNRLPNIMFRTNEDGSASASFYTSGVPVRPEPRLSMLRVAFALVLLGAAVWGAGAWLGYWGLDPRPLLGW